jgi:hypothetical protein
MNDVHIHHNYLHDLGAEGLYVGSSGYASHPGDYVMRRVNIHHNTLINTGEPIQVASCVEDCKVHHNYIEKANPLGSAVNHTVSAIAVAPGANSVIYNNVIIDCEGAGILLNTTFPTTIYNNLIVDTGYVLTTEAPDAILCMSTWNTIYNNTIITAHRHGIRFPAWATHDYVYNNIILDTGDDSIRKGGNPEASFHHNLTKEGGYTPANFGFVDPANGDYHLTEGSPAVDAGVDSGLGSDFDGRSRPVGAYYDVGAYEFVED